MKELGKLTINPEKVIKNEELVNLRGGYDDGYGIPPHTGNCYFRELWIGSVYCPECGLPCLDNCHESFPEYYITNVICFS